MTSNQEAARLQALDLGTIEKVEAAFEKQLASICSYMSMMYEHMTHAIIANPTLAARKFLKRSDIQAEAVSDRILAVYPCLPVPRDSFSIANMTGMTKCHEYTPVNVAYGVDNISGYYDRITRIIAEDSREIPCDMAQSQIVHVYDKFYEIDQASNLVRELDRESTDGIPYFSTESIEPQVRADIPMTIYHNMVITNISEIFPSTHMESLIHNWHMKGEIEKARRGTMKGQPSGASNFKVDQGGISWVLDFIPWFKFYTGGTSTIYVLEKLVTLAAMYMAYKVRKQQKRERAERLTRTPSENSEVGGWPSRLSKRWRRRERKREIRSKRKGSKDAHIEKLGQEEFELQCECLNCARSKQGSCESERGNL